MKSLGKCDLDQCKGRVCALIGVAASKVRRLAISCDSLQHRYRQFRARGPKSSHERGVSVFARAARCRGAGRARRGCGVGATTRSTRGTAGSSWSLRTNCANGPLAAVACWIVHSRFVLLRGGLDSRYLRRRLNQLLPGQLRLVPPSQQFIQGGNDFVAVFL
jgi:hypothetical protein